MMSEALLRNRDYTVILAKSPSENTPGEPLPLDRWQAASWSIVALASKCLEFDPDGITIYIAADLIKQYKLVKEEQITLLFQEFKETAPPESCNLAEGLQTALDDYFARKAVGQAKENGEIIIVVTDEEPPERQEVVKEIVNATNKIERDEELGIGFAQIGQHSLTQGFFLALDDDLHKAGARFDIVDTKVLDTIEINSLIQFLLDIVYD
jgi:hypothetical protein